MCSGSIHCDMDPDPGGGWFYSPYFDSCMIRYSQISECPRTWCPLDHTRRHPWKCLVLAVKIILLKDWIEHPPPPSIKLRWWLLLCCSFNSHVSDLSAICRRWDIAIVSEPTHFIVSRAALQIRAMLISVSGSSTDLLGTMALLIDSSSKYVVHCRVKMTRNLFRGMCQCKQMP